LAFPLASFPLILGWQDSQSRAAPGVECGASEIPTRPFFNRIHHEQQVGVQGAMRLVPPLAGAIAGLFLAEDADSVADGCYVVLDPIAIRGLNRVDNLGKQAKQGAIAGLPQPTAAICGAVRARTAELIADDALQFR
jgi:hypothetical protein